MVVLMDDSSSSPDPGLGVGNSVTTTVVDVEATMKERENGGITLRYKTTLD